MRFPISSSRKGTSLIELVLTVVALGIILGAGAKTMFRQLNIGADLIAQRQAVDLAQQVMESRLASGKFPSSSEMKTLARNKTGAFVSSAVETKYGDTDLMKVAVTVAWHGSGNRKKEVKFVSLMGKD